MKTMSAATNSEKVQIQKAINNTFSLIGSGWDLELAVKCTHDAVYDIIDLDDFIVQCQAMLKMAKPKCTHPNMKEYHDKAICFDCGHTTYGHFE